MKEFSVSSVQKKVTKTNVLQHEYDYEYNKEDCSQLGRRQKQYLKLVFDWKSSVTEKFHATTTAKNITIWRTCAGPKQFLRCVTVTIRICVKVHHQISSRSYGISLSGMLITINYLDIWEKLWSMRYAMRHDSNCNRQNMLSVRCEMRLKTLLSFEHQAEPIVKVDYRYWTDTDCKFPLLR